jgi:hypothetical protein
MGERVGVHFTWDHSDCGLADTVYLFQMISVFSRKMTKTDEKMSFHT